MRTSTHRWLALAFLPLLAAPLARAGETYLIAVGVAEADLGKAKGWKPLPMVGEDVERLAKVFDDTSGQRRNLYYFVTDKDLGREAAVMPPLKNYILKYLREVARNARAQDLVIFYFSGHGFYDPALKDTVLVTQDTDPDDLKNTALKLGDVRDILSASACQRVLGLIDACRTPLTDEWSKNIRVGLVAQTTPGRQATTFLACDVGETANFVKPNDPATPSVFTSTFVTALQSLGQRTAQVRLQPLATEVKQQMARWALAANCRQTPVLDPTNADFLVYQRMACSKISATPPTTTIWLVTPDGEQEVGRANTLLNLPVGAHDFRLKAEGYETLATTITVPPEGGLVGDYDLRLLPGRLLIGSTPKGARVLIDGQAVPDERRGQPAVTPCQVAVAPGQRTLRLEADGGYRPLETIVEVVSGKLLDLDYTLELPRGSCRVVTEPPGAEILIAGQAQGAAPVELTLEAGRYTLEARLAGHEPASTVIEVVAGQPASPPTLTLRPLPGRLAVTSEPAGAQVLLDGAATGLVTPCALTAPPGEHTVTLRLTGRLDAAETVRLLPGQDAPAVHLILPPPPKVPVRVVSAPPGAILWLDGREVGPTPLVVELEPGEHKFALALAGYRPAEETRRLALGTLVEPVQVILQPLPARLAVRVTPVGATVTLDGRPWPEPAGGAIELPPGTVAVEASAPGRQTVGERVTLGPGEVREVVLNLPLPRPGRVFVATNPPGATVGEAGRALGQTPVTLDLPPGEHVLDIALAGYAPAQRRLTVQTNTELPPLTLDLTALPVTLRVVTEPAGARVTVAGLPVAEVSPCQVEVQPGTVVVTADLAGRRAERQVTLAPGQAGEARLVLPPPAVGRVRLVSEPSGAEIAVGDERLGTTPAVIERAPGRYTFRLTKVGYAPAELIVDAVGGELREAPPATLTALPVTLSVTTRPAGATVSLDGRPQPGLTPWRAELPPGTVRLRVELAGHQPVERQVTLLPGQPQELPAIELAPVVALVEVASVPVGAAIQLGGKRLGYTPAQLALPPGRHRLELTLSGHRPGTLEVTVTGPEPQAPPAVRLEALPGRFAVTTRPAGAMVVIDGRDTGEVTPCVVAVAPGQHYLEVKLAGRNPVRQSVTVGPGETLTVPEIVLLELGLPDGWPATLARYVKPEKAQLRLAPSPDKMPQVLVPGGQFTLGSNRGDNDEQPPKRVAVSAFWMDVHEVTVGQYLQFTTATRRALPSQPRWSTLEHPVVNVTAEDADAYAAWAGRRLPSEAQWEYAARGTRDDLWRPAQWRDDGDEFDGPGPVGSFPPNEFGVCDLAGSVREWCRDWYWNDRYKHLTDTRDPVLDKPQGEFVRIWNDPLSGMQRIERVPIALKPYRVIRGGCWWLPAEQLRLTDRRSAKPTMWDSSLGFRCVSPAG